MTKTNTAAKLTANQQRILDALRADEHGMMYTGELCDAAGLTPRQGARVVGYMTARGLLHFVSHDSDFGNLYTAAQ